MKFYRCLAFIILLFVLACQSASSNVSTQSSPILQTKPAIATPSPSSAPSPTRIFTATPSQTPVPSAIPTLPPSLIALRVVYSDGKNVWLWQSNKETLLTTIEHYTEVKLSADGEMVALRRNGQLWVINSDGTD